MRLFLLLCALLSVAAYPGQHRRARFHNYVQAERGLSHVEKLFDKYDKDRTGSLNLKEFKAGAAALGMTCTECLQGAIKVNADHGVANNQDDMNDTCCSYCGTCKGN